MHDKDFGIAREWDIDLLNGYDHEFVRNISTKPGSHHYKGIINPSLIEQVEQFKPETILIYGWKFQSHLKLMRHFHGRVPILFRGDSTLLDEHLGFSLKKFIRFKFLKWVYGHVDIAFSPGKSSDDYFIACGLKPAQIVRAPHAVDNDFFSADADQKEKEAMVWRQQLGIPDDHKIFLFAGKLKPKKDPELLINAFFKLLQKSQHIHLVIVGSGVLEKRLRALVNSITTTTSHNLTQPITDNQQPTTHNPQPITDNQQPTTHNPALSSHISFLPFQNQSRMPVVYRMADIFVLPSKGPGETWGLAVNEAMACGKPVIVSDKCGAAADMINEGINGYVFQSTFLESLLDKMLLILNADLSSFGKASKKHVQQFSYESFKIALKSYSLSKNLQVDKYE